MDEERLPLLIFGQTARFIAQSAAQLGYTTWVVDCFADRDTQKVADRCIRIPPLELLSIESILTSFELITQQQRCLLIFSTGIERFYELLNCLPTHIQILGNDFQVLDKLRSPQRFFPLLQQLDIPFPETHWVQAFDKKKKRWITKDLMSSGGIHIQDTDITNYTARHLIFQEYINGRSGSVSFLADGESVFIFGFNEQIHHTETFQLQQIINHFDISQSSKATLAKALEKLVTAITFRGYGSLDFMIDELANIYILELNPRLSASAELYANNTDMLRWHIQACIGKLPAEIQQQNSEMTNVTSLSYLFADKALFVKSKATWPVETRDIPHARQKIQPGEPVCTVLVEAQSHLDCDNKRHQVETEIRKNCLCSA